MMKIKTSCTTTFLFFPSSLKNRPPPFPVQMIFYGWLVGHPENTRFPSPLSQTSESTLSRTGKVLYEIWIFGYQIIIANLVQRIRQANRSGKTPSGIKINTISNHCLHYPTRVSEITWFRRGFFIIIFTVTRQLFNF